MRFEKKEPQAGKERATELGKSEHILQIPARRLIYTMNAIDGAAGSFVKSPSQSSSFRQMTACAVSVDDEHHEKNKQDAA